MVSIVVSTHKRRVFLSRLLLTLGKTISCGPTEVVVVDQQPEDLFDEKILKNYPRVQLRYFPVREFASLPKARNCGIKKSEGDIIIFCDDDVIPATGFIEKFLHYYEEKTISGVCGCIMITKNGQLVTMPNRKEPGLIMPQVKGGFFSFRKEVLFEVGGFDEEYLGPALREESDLVARVLRAGYRVIFAPEITGIHLDVKTGGCHAVSHHRERLVIQNNFRYAIRNLSLGWFYFWIFLIFRECVLTRKNAKHPARLMVSLRFYARYFFWAVTRRDEIKRKVNYLI